MEDEAEEVAIDCCKSLILNALDSKIVQNKLRNLGPYDEEKKTIDDKMTWQILKKKMDDSRDKTKKLMEDTEFHDFLEGFISDTMFDITDEMLENSDNTMNKENIDIAHEK